MIRVMIRDKGRKNLLLYYVDPATKKEISKSAGTSDRKDAERAAARWEDELLKFRGVDNCGWGYFRQRFEDAHLAAMGRRTRNGYIEALDHFVRLFKPASVATVTTDQVTQFKAALIREKRPLTTVAKILTHLRVAFNFAERNGFLRKCPHFDMPRTVDQRFMKGRPITDDEVQLMLKHTNAPFGDAVAPTWRRMIEMLRLSGLRLEEGALLSWDTPPYVVRLDTKPHPVLQIYGKQKSRKDETVPITPDFATWLERTPPKDRKGLVAPVLGDRKTPLGWEAIGKGITAIGEAAKIIVNDEGKFASAHDLRRAFGVEWSKKVRPLTLKKLMRHKSIETTLKFYIGMDSADAGDEVWKGVSREVSRKQPQKRRTPKKKAAKK